MLDVLLDVLFAEEDLEPHVASLILDARTRVMLPNKYDVSSPFIGKLCGATNLTKDEETEKYGNSGGLIIFISLCAGH